MSFFLFVFALTEGVVPTKISLFWAFVGLQYSPEDDLKFLMLV